MALEQITDKNDRILNDTKMDSEKNQWYEFSNRFRIEGSYYIGH